MANPGSMLVTMAAFIIADIISVVLMATAIETCIQPTKHAALAVEETAGATSKGLQKGCLIALHVICISL